MPAASPVWLSLPPSRPSTPEEAVAAPFVLPVIQALAAQPAAAGAMAALFTAGAAPALLADRPTLLLDPNPLPLLALAVQRQGPAPEQIASGLSRLLDQPYRGRPWGQYLQSLYLTSCPACWRPAMVAAYRWQGAPPALIAKQVHCDYCDFQGETHVDADDQARAAEVEPGPMLRWEMLARVAPPEDPLRPRVEQALGFYTPRNLWGLWQTIRILDDLAFPREERRALQWLLAGALWQGSSLAGQTELLWQGVLRRPRRFRERNLWLVLHEALASVQQQTGQLGRARGPADEGPDLQLAQRWPAAAADRAQPGSAGLILLSVPPPLPLYWLLQFVWSGWLFGRQAVATMPDLLSLRPGGDDLLQRMVATALHTADAWLTAEGRSLVQWRWQADADPSPAVLAALPAFDGQIGIASLSAEEWVAVAAAPKRSEPAPAGLDRPRARGAEAMQQLLAARGEPAPAARLRPAILAAWRSQAQYDFTPELRGHLDALLDPLAPPAGLEVLSEHGEPWEPGDAAWWWLLDPPDPWHAASDAAELESLALLQETTFTDVDACAWALTLRLPLIHTPDRPWIEALLQSYTVASAGATGFHLRPEDDPARRRPELAELAQLLLAQGQRMGFEATNWAEAQHWVVEWQRQGRRRASFILSASTALTPRVWRSRALIPGHARYLVLPGSRASLLQWRFDHQPLWASAAAAGGWTFVKFRHLRQMLADSQSYGDADPDIWLAHLGLDAVTSAHGEQMRLF